MRSSSRLVGRQADVERLDDALAAVAADARLRVVLVSGEAGIGKSRLVRELHALAPSRGVRVLVGRCVEHGEEVLPLAALREIVVTLAEQFDDESFRLVMGQSRRGWAQLVPDLFEDEVPVPMTASSVCESVVALVRRVAHLGPIAVVFEDLHWADVSTRRIFSLLAAASWIGPVLLVGTYRADELHRRHPLNALLAEVVRGSRPERIELQELTAADVASLCAAIDPNLDDALVRDVHRRSGGNPFFVEELVAAGGLASTALPETLRQVVAARAAELDEPAIDVLHAVSAGGSLTPPVIGDVTGLDDDLLESTLDELLGMGLLVHDRDCVRFRHELAREVFDELAPGRAAALHGQLAVALEQRASRRPGEIARHWFAAHDQPKALAASVHAGRDALTVGAAAEAQGHFGRALEMWLGVTDAPTVAGIDHVDLLMAASTAAKHARHVDVSIDLARRAAAELEGVDPVREGEVWLHLRDLYRFTKKWEECADAVRRALLLIPSGPPSSARATALAQAALGEYYGNRLEEHRVLAEQALTMAETVGEPDVVVLARSVYLIALDDDPERGLAAAMANVAMCDELVSPERTLVALNALAHVHLRRSRFSDLLAVGRRGLALARETGLGGPYSTTMAHFVKSSLLQLGRWDELDAVLPELSDLSDLDDGAYPGLAFLRRGRLEEARTLLDPLRSALQTDDLREGVALTAAYAIEQDAADRCELDVVAFTDVMVERALAELPYGLEELLAEAICALADRVRDVRTDRRPEVRASWCAIAERWIERLMTAPQPSRWPSSSIQRERAHAELARLRNEPDPHAWTAIAHGWSSLEMPYEEAYARWRAAEAHMAGPAGRSAAARQRATSELVAARAIAERLRAVPLIARIDELARQARLTMTSEVTDDAPTQSADVAPFGLTARERHILALLAAGRSNGEIGAELYISTKTASVHVSNILRKLEVTNRVEAAAVAHRHELVPGA